MTELPYSGSLLPLLPSSDPLDLQADLLVNPRLYSTAKTFESPHVLRNLSQAVC